MMRSLRVGSAAVVTAVALLLVQPLMTRGTDQQRRGPQDVTLMVTWKATQKLNAAQVLWTFGLFPTIANAKDTPENAAGGSWRRDITLPEPHDEYVVALSASVVPWKTVDSLGRELRQSTAITCTIIDSDGAKSDTSTATPLDSCAVTKKVYT
jgi:hypothetical protein